MRYLDAAGVREALPAAEAIASMESAFGGDWEAPVRTRLAGSLFMPGRVGANTAIKVVSVVPGRPSGIVVVFGSDGRPLGLVDGPALTALRTGAASGLATRLLAPPDARVLAMLGAGAMAFDQVQSVRAVRPIERVLVWSRTRDRAETLAARVGGVACAEADAAVAEAEIVCCATPATGPLFEDGSLRRTVHINAVGAFTPQMVEVPSETVQRAFVVVDDQRAAAEEAGDLIQAGRLPADATLGELLLGGPIVPGGGVTLFKSVGVASQDVAAALRALELAAERGIGLEIPESLSQP